MNIAGPEIFNQPICNIVGGPSMLELLELADKGTPPTHCEKCKAAYEILTSDPCDEEVEFLMDMLDEEIGEAYED